jgi:ABC-type Fe3+/spermidine/putrescine transport system ATPase subunit
VEAALVFLWHIRNLGNMLKAEHLHFSYSNEPVIRNVSFYIEQGDHVSVIGESGCGKSTLLKLIYGIHDLDSGQLSYNGKTIKGPKHSLVPGEEHIKYLAQDFGLMPYISVRENVGKYLSNVNKLKKQQRIDELLELVEMTEHADVKAQHLSGGQQQRVGLAMVLAHEPKVLLLDEPFSQIDAFRTNTLRRSTFSYLKANKITCIVATHDHDDALSFADEILVLKSGEIVASGTPTEVYNNPASRYVASLFGDVNVIPGSEIGSSESQVLVYPHQLRTSGSGIRVTVKTSYFRGDSFLIESTASFGTVYFYKKTKMPPGSMAFLNLQQ